MRGEEGLEASAQGRIAGAFAFQEGGAFGGGLGGGQGENGLFAVVRCGHERYGVVHPIVHAQSEKKKYEEWVPRHPSGCVAQHRSAEDDQRSVTSRQTPARCQRYLWSRQRQRTCRTIRSSLLSSV